MQNIDNWFVTYPDAIRRKEQHFRQHRGDLFPVLSKPLSPLATLLRKSDRITRLFSIQKSRSDLISDKATTYWSDGGFKQAICAITVIAGLAILFGPMWWLHYVESVLAKLGIITAFVALFAFWLWVAAGPKQFEILLGTAAYAAVLYIYLQASSGPPSSVSTTPAGETSGPMKTAAKSMRVFKA